MKNMEHGAIAVGEKRKIIFMAKDEHSRRSFGWKMIPFGEVLTAFSQGGWSK